MSEDKGIKSLLLTDEDILKAMKEISGYLDITPEDFKELYKKAYNHAIQRLLTSIKAKDIMSKEVVFVEADTPLYEVAYKMGKAAVSGVPVVKENKVIGVISEKDFIFHINKEVSNFLEIIAECLKGQACLMVDLREATAKDIMTTPAITVFEDSPLKEIVKHFSEKNINRLPVINDKERLIGIVTREDILKVFKSNLGI